MARSRFALTARTALPALPKPDPWQRARAVAQAGIGAALALMVLLGGLDFHPAAESQEPLAALSAQHQAAASEEYYPAASHPVQPPHAENATAAQRPFCAICFNRSQGSGARPTHAARLSTLLSGPSLPAAVAVSPLQRSLRPDGARAPPAA
jgi:hypothetical protein